MTKRPVLAIALLATVTVALAGCVYIPIPVGPRVTEDRDIDDVTAIVLKTGGDLVVTLGDEPELTITAREAAMDRLTSEVEDGVLTLSAKGPHLGLGDVRYAITLPMISDIAIDGSGDVVADFTGADEIRVSIKGSGDIEGTGIDASVVETSIEGSGDIELIGRADEHTLEIDGSGNFDGDDLETGRTRVTISGSGDVEVNVADELDVEIRGSGEVRYTGDPEVTSDISGAGDVVQDD